MVPLSRSIITSGWMGSKSSKYLTGAVRQLLHAGSGRRTTTYGASRLVDNANVGPLPQGAAQFSAEPIRIRGTKKMSDVSRMKTIASAEANVRRGLKSLPVKTKIGLPVAAVGIYSWMHRSKKDNFYTHYYDF